ncbi:hypothetical protein [Halogranum rubrum]|uniref:Lipoprotein n=1 Tax=Halogranum salarium B-1 TaxID=1210908 RepID=J3JHJ9_9EURY|nr:hypothetical protein [Halogranum salarium]EJN61064.1 hypothetical protein HSB1_01050 [Halogranum salarium B-1]
MSPRPGVVCVLLLLTAGCLGGTADPASSPTVSPTATFTDQCTAIEKPVVDPSRESVTPSELPEGPPQMTESAVVEYVVAYEEAYGRNRLLRDDTKRASQHVSDPVVRLVDGGFVVEVRTYESALYQREASGNETTTGVYLDGARIDVSYLVTEDRLLRAESDSDGAPPPRDGKTMECW